MKAILRIVFFLSVATLANAENLPTPASSTVQDAPATPKSATAQSAGSGAMGSSSATADLRKASRARSRPPATAQFSQDLAACKQLEAEEERRTCERETWAARYEGLYRE